MHKIENKTLSNTGKTTPTEILKDSIRKLNHDVRSPINGIVGIASLLIEDKETVEVKTRDIVMIKEAGETIVDIIDEVLHDIDVTRKKSLAAGQKTLSEILEKIQRLYRPLVQKKKLSFTVDNQFDNMLKVPYKLSIKLQQIIGNLVSNAIKFTSENGEVLVVTKHNIDNNQEILNITVENTGKSMRTDQISAFNHGHHVTRSVGTNGEQSFGIGLQHVKKLVQEEQGEITVSSLNGKGTSFSVLIPFQNEIAAEIVEKKAGT